MCFCVSTFMKLFSCVYFRNYNLPALRWVLVPDVKLDHSRAAGQQSSQNHQARHRRAAAVETEKQQTIINKLLSTVLWICLSSTQNNVNVLKAFGIILDVKIKFCKMLYRITITITNAICSFMLVSYHVLHDLVGDNKLWQTLSQHL